MPRPSVRLHGAGDALNPEMIESFNAFLALGPSDVAVGDFRPVACWDGPTNYTGAILRTYLCRRPGSCMPGIAPELSKLLVAELSALLRRDR